MSALVTHAVDLAKAWGCFRTRREGRVSVQVPPVHKHFPSWLWRGLADMSGVFSCDRSFAEGVCEPVPLPHVYAKMHPWLTGAPSNTWVRKVPVRVRKVPFYILFHLLFYILLCILWPGQRSGDFLALWRVNSGQVLA